MIIAEYTIDHPILRKTIQRNPGVEITWEDSYPGSDGSENTLVWIDSDDFTAVEAALRDDPTVADSTVLTEAGDRRLYRFELSAAGAEQSITPLLAEVGGVHQNLVADENGWHNRTKFPDRSAFEQVYQFCRDHGLTFTVDQIYRTTDDTVDVDGGLSDTQRDTLIEAVESGYLDIPRHTSLAELGDRLGVSESAVSERFRRGVKTLIRETIME